MFGDVAKDLHDTDILQMPVWCFGQLNALLIFAQYQDKEHTGEQVHHTAVVTVLFFEQDPLSSDHKHKMIQQKIPGKYRLRPLEER